MYKKIRSKISNISLELVEGKIKRKIVTYHNTT